MEQKEPIDSIFKKLDCTKEGLSSKEAGVRLLRYGTNRVEEKKESIAHKIFKYFWGPIPWMIEAAAILSLSIRHWPDFFFITALLFFNAFVAFFQEFQAGSAIEALKRKLAVQSRVLRDGSWQEIEASQLVPGDIIRIRLGDIVPADALLIEGEPLSVDQSALTGESLPVNKGVGETLFSGSIIHKGEMVALVTATGKESYFGKTVKLVAAAKPVSHFQKAVLQIGDFLIYLCLILVMILFVVQLGRGDSVFQLLKFSLVLIIASIPIALPAVLSVTMAVGALALSKMKAIVTRLQSIEEMAGVDTLFSDKTGTLTQNKLTAREPALFGQTSKEELFQMAALASRAEDRDIIDLTILEAANSLSVKEGFKQTHFVPFDPVSKRTEATVEGPGGQIFQVTKGAPQVILELCKPEPQIEKRAEKLVEEYALKGYRTLGVGKQTSGGNWHFAGLIPLYDPPREDSKETIEQAKAHGIHVKMVTGDNLAIAKEISEELGIGKNIVPAKQELTKEIDLGHIAEKVEQADGFAQVFPENKYVAVKSLQAKGHIVGMTGDGVNDAPALKQADLGIAVSGATDAARSAASLVLTAPGLSVIIRAVEEARRIFERMNSYAIYRIAETINIMIFMILAILIYNFYPITALMIIMLAFLNDIPIMTIAYDNAQLAKEPVRWNMRRVLFTASVLGIINVLETFLLLVIALKWLEASLEELRSMIFLTLTIAGHLTFFVSRTRRGLFFKPHPSAILLIAIIGTQIIAALIVGFGIFVAPLPWSTIGAIWIYCLAWMFFQDIAKLLLYRHLDLSHRYHKQFLHFSTNPLHSHFSQKSQK